MSACMHTAWMENRQNVGVEVENVGGWVEVVKANPAGHLIFSFLFF